MENSFTEACKPYCVSLGKDICETATIVPVFLV